MRRFGRGQVMSANRIVTSCAAISILTGCASTQLNYITLDVGSTATDLQKRQVLYNLSLFIDDPAALPTHLDLQSGQTQTSNTIQPTVGVPLAATQVIQSTASTAMGGSIANELQATRAPWTLSVQGQNAEQQNWSYQPIVDGKELLRLRALYRYAVGAYVDSTDRFVPCASQQSDHCVRYD